MQTAIIVSPYFPPATLAGVHRARHLSKHLPSHGWRPVVIRVDERFYHERIDRCLLDLVPAHVEQRRTGALPSSFTRPLGIGDIGLRAFFHLSHEISRSVQQLQPKVVLITGSPYYPMLLARKIASCLGIPVVLDFQDPWVSAHGATLPKWSKGGMAHQLAVKCEPRALHHASHITSVSETQNAQMAAMYPWLDSSRMSAIPIGGDPEDFDALRGRPIQDPKVRLEDGRFNLSYVGTFLPRAAPVLRALFKAVRTLKEIQPRLADRLNLNFVGTSNQPNYTGSGLVAPFAAEAGIADLVVETPQRVPFMEALSVLTRSNGLLLIGSDEPHYTASKIYPALMSGRPYVSLFHAASSAHQILTAAGGGRTFSFSNGAELSSLAPVISKALVELLSVPESFGRAAPAAYETYTAHNVARQFGDVFERVAQ